MSVVPEVLVRTYSRKVLKTRKAVFFAIMQFRFRAFRAEKKRSSIVAVRERCQKCAELVAHVRGCQGRLKKANSKVFLMYVLNNLCFLSFVVGVT